MYSKVCVWVTANKQVTLVTKEFPDPITRVSWDNYVTFPRHDAEKLGLESMKCCDGASKRSLCEITVDGVAVMIPVIVQPDKNRLNDFPLSLWQNQLYEE